MKNITLRQLRYFETLSRHRHFGRAAEACAISQPALSVQIRELEQSLDVQLFERSARQVRLSQFGTDLAEKVRDILRSVDELGDMARAAQGQLAGRLRVGVIPTIAPYLLPRTIEILTGHFEGLDIHVRETLTSNLLQDLSDGRIDTAIVALPVSEPAFEEAHLFTESFVLVRPAAEADQPAPHPDALADQRLLLLEEGHCFRDQALSFCGIRSSAPRDGLDASSLSTLVQMVGAGLGNTLIPEMAIPVETENANVSVTRFDGAGPARTVGMIWRKTSPLADQMARVAELLKTRL